MKKAFVFACVCVFFLINSAFAQDQGMTSETHRNNIGKILWAKQRINFNEQDSIKYDTVFDVSDPLYGRVYLPKSLYRLSEDQGQDCINHSSYFEVRAFVNGVYKGVLNSNYFGSSSWTTVQINLNLSAGDQTDSVNSNVPRKWSALLKTLDDGTYDVKFEFFGGQGKCAKKFAEGSFTLNKKGEQKAQLMKELPAAQKRDPKLEASMLEAFKKRGWDEEAIRIIIVEGDWRIIRNALGTIVRREINTNIILKKKTGTCRLTDISFIQPYQGNGKYGMTEVYGIGMKNIPFDCNAVK